MVPTSLAEGNFPDRAAARRTGSGSLGSGLGPLPLLGILSLAVLVFLFWDDPLWRAPVGASHLTRILVSYLVVVPLVGGALALARRFRTVHLVSGVGLIWAVKLLLTSTLYYYLTPESAQHYVPSRRWETSSAEPRAIRETGYRAAAGATVLHDVDGVLVAGGAPVAAAVVSVDRPPPGRPVDPPQKREWEIRGGAYAPAVQWAATSDSLTIVNHDPALHTARVSSGGRIWSNVPVPAGAVQTIPTPPPGTYEIRCENHADERATLVVVDHPYAAVSDASGRFALHGVPAAAHDLWVVAPGRAPALHTIAPAGGPIMIDLGVPSQGGGE